MTPSTNKHRGSRLPSIFVLTDDVRLPDARHLAATMPNDWGLVVRHYETTDRARLAAEVARICKARGVFLLIAGHWRLACAVQADGVHMPEGLLRNRANAPLLNACKTKVLTTSAHGPQGLRLARSVGADAVFLSPVKATKSHVGGRPLGRLPFAALARSYGIPTYALGGLDFHDHTPMRALGAAGIAGIGLASDRT